MVVGVEVKNVVMQSSATVPKYIPRKKLRTAFWKGLVPERWSARDA
jgi:hypothetical protein